MCSDSIASVERMNIFVSNGLASYIAMVLSLPVLMELYKHVCESTAFDLSFLRLGIDPRHMWVNFFYGADRCLI